MLSVFELVSTRMGFSVRSGGCLWKQSLGRRTGTENSLVLKSSCSQMVSLDCDWHMKISINESRFFCIQVAALNDFVKEQGAGEFPLEGSIPDMTSFTEYVNFAGLQKLRLWICPLLCRSCTCAFLPQLTVELGLMSR
jgi:hypothetical protein